MDNLKEEINQIPRDQEHQSACTSPKERQFEDQQPFLQPNERTRLLLLGMPLPHFRIRSQSIKHVFDNYSSRLCDPMYKSMFNIQIKIKLKFLFKNNS